MAQSFLDEETAGIYVARRLSGLIVEPGYTMIRSFIVRLAVVVAVFLGWTAYACWAVSKNWGRGNLDLLGVSVPFPIGMVLLVGLALLFALGAVYALLNIEN